MPQTLRAASFIDKGGTGKTTAIAHLGVASAMAGHRVLLIDLAGKQSDLAKHFGIWESYREQFNNDNAWPNITTVFQDEWSVIADRLGNEAVEELIFSTEEFVDIIPAHPGLDSLDAELGNIDDTRDRYSRLNTFLNNYIDPLNYDVVLLDLPGLTNNISYNGLWAAPNLIAPVEMGPFESDQADRLRDDLHQMRDTFNIEISLAMVLPTKIDTRTRLAEQYLNDYRETYPEAIAPEPIPQSQDIRNAAENGQTVFRLASPSNTAHQARKAFRSNANALIQRISNT